MTASRNSRSRLVASSCTPGSREPSDSLIVVPFSECDYYGVTFDVHIAPDEYFPEVLQINISRLKYIPPRFRRGDSTDSLVLRQARLQGMIYNIAYYLLIHDVCQYCGFDESECTNKPAEPM